MFIAYLKQAGEGSDYTIGFGLRLLVINAGSYNDAIKKLKEEILGKWDEEDRRFYDAYYGGEIELSAVTLFEVSKKHTIPINEWYEESKEIQKKVKEQSVEDKEKKELERLKNKYE